MSLSEFQFMEVTHSQTLDMMLLEERKPRKIAELINTAHTLLFGGGITTDYPAVKPLS